MRDNKYIRALVMSIVIIIAMTLVMDLSDFLAENSERVIKLGVNPACNSSVAICSASRNNEGNFQRISLALKKEKLKESQKFKVLLTAAGFDFEGIESISVSFEVMDTNIKSPLLLLIPDKSTHQPVAENWYAIAELPLEVNDRNQETAIDKEWRAIISLKSSEKEYRAEFPFSFRAGN